MNGGDATPQERSPARLDSPLLPTLATAAAYLLFLLARLQMQGWNPYVFVTAGDGLCDRAQVPKEMPLLKGLNGYDGQFYFRLALNPFTREEVAYGMKLDFAPYRHQRIVYPLLAWGLSRGQPRSAAIALIVVNYVGLCLIAWLGARIAQTTGRHALWGLGFSLYPGFVLTLARDLPEIVQIAFLLAAFLLLRRGRHVGATLSLVLAVLTKEPSIVVAVAAAIVWAAAAWRKSDASRPRWYFFAVPSLVFVLWQSALWAWWGRLPMSTGYPSFTTPLRDFIACSLLMHGLNAPQYITYFFEFYFLGAALVASACALPSSSATPLEKTAWILYAVLGLMLTSRVWVEDWGFMRILSEFYVLSAMVLIASRSPLKSAVFGTAGALWATLFITRR